MCRAADIGFNSDRNEVTIVTANDTIAVPEASKLDVAEKILELRCGSSRKLAAKLEGAQR